MQRHDSDPRQTPPDPGYDPTAGDPTSILPSGDLGIDDERALGEEQRGRLAGALINLVLRGSRRDIERHTRHTNRMLRGTVEYEEPVINPLTGSPYLDGNGDPRTVRGSRLVNPLIIPVSKKVHARMDQPASRGQSWEANPEHPLLASIGKSISRGDFRSAKGAVDEIERVLEHATTSRPGLMAKAVNPLLPKSERREQYIHRTYGNMIHAVYETVMDAQPDGHRLKPASAEVEGRDWSPVLELSSIQALRAKAAEVCAATGTIDTRLVEMSVRSGGLINLAPRHLAAYLGVDEAKLRSQIQQGGEPVVPAIILTKLNFFLQFASDKMPRNGLTEALHEFNSAPARNIDPVKRMRRVDEPAVRQSRQRPTMTWQEHETRDRERAERSRQERSENAWERTLDYVSGRTRSGKPNTVFPTMSRESLQGQFEQPILKGLLREYGLDSSSAWNNLSEKEKEEVINDAKERTRRVVAEQWRRLLDEGVVDPNHTYGESYKVLMDNDQIQQKLKNFQAERQRRQRNQRRPS